MKQRVVFKVLLDILFVIHCFGFGSLIFNLPFGDTKVTMADTEVENWGLIFWIVLIVSICSYFCFLAGIWFLRKVGKQLIDANYFTMETIANLHRSGKYLTISGSLGIAVIVLILISKLTINQIQFTNQQSLLLNLFIILAGFFFLIQAKVLISAKTIKEENDLTI